MSGAATRVLVPLAAGFEEIEAVTIVDLLRRAGLEVVVAGLAPGPVRGSHDLVLATDAELADVDAETFGLLVLPGGPGTRLLAADERVLALVRSFHARGARVAAICAAPLVLHAAGIVHGVAVTSHPSVRAQLAGAVVQDAPPVVRAGNVTTSQGAGTAIEFALALVADLCGAPRADELARAIVFRP